MPERVAGDPRFGKDDKLRAVSARFEDQVARLVDGGITIEEDGRRLDGGGGELWQRVAHRCVLRAVFRKEWHYTTLSRALAVGETL